LLSAPGSRIWHSTWQSPSCSPRRRGDRKLAYGLNLRPPPYQGGGQHCRKPVPAGVSWQASVGACQKRVIEGTEFVSGRLASRKIGNSRPVSHLASIDLIFSAVTMHLRPHPRQGRGPPLFLERRVVGMSAGLGVKDVSAGAAALRISRRKWTGAPPEFCRCIARTRMELCSAVDCIFLLPSREKNLDSSRYRRYKRTRIVWGRPQ
jgi:hypothetical protein